MFTDLKVPSIIFIGILLFISCTPKKQTDNIIIWKQEILQTEKEFERCVKNEGMTAAFTKYAAENAVMNHGDKLIKSKKAINEFYVNKNADKNKLTWEAEFVDVSSAGDLGYTYGSYTYTVIDSLGLPKEYNGIFHTVWKKQTDGSWKFVWD